MASPLLLQVHSYTVAGSTGRTAYLAELKSGSEVQVADASGMQRQAIVGRCKIENRPLVSAIAALVTAASITAQTLYCTLCMHICFGSAHEPYTPAHGACSSTAAVVLSPVVQVLVEVRTEDGVLHSIILQNAETVKLVGLAEPAPAAAPGLPSHNTPWKALPVTELKPSDTVLVHLQGPARHTGIDINEAITEK